MTDPKIQPGQPAPDFCLPDQDQKQTCLKDLKGQWIVLYFYPKDNTPGCTLEAKQFTDALDEFASSGVKVLGVSPDSVESHCNFIDKHALKITLLSDQDKQAAKMYDVWKPKKMMGKEFLGIVRSTFLIDPEGIIQHVWPKVKVKGHVDEVRAKYAELCK